MGRFRFAAPHDLASMAALGSMVVLVSCVALVARTAPPPGGQGAGDPQNSAAHAYGKLPLSFIPNRGQIDGRIRYYAQARAMSAYFERDRATLALRKGARGFALQLRFTGANPRARLEPLLRGRGRVNYLASGDRSRWRTDIPTYAGVRYRDLWPGIDLAFKGAAGVLKYEFTVRPGADPRQIRLRYVGAGGLSITEGGALAIQTALGTLIDAKPRSFQPAGPADVPTRFAPTGHGSYGFALGAHDQSRPLVIDPGFAYSTFLGGSGDDRGYAIAVDGAGNAYVAGLAGSGFPTTPGSYRPSASGGGFVTKLNPTGSGLVYSTFFDTTISGIDVDAAGSAYITGTIINAPFTTTEGAYDRTFNGVRDVFVTKLNPSGSALDYSTYLGGSGNDFADDIAVDASGNAYVTGHIVSTDFPTTPGSYDTTMNGVVDAFVTKLNPSGSALVYSTYLGGAGGDRARSVVVDPDGEAYVAGFTSSGNFPVTAGAFDTTLAGGQDGFVTKLNADGSDIADSTFFGGSSVTDGIESIALDGRGNVFGAGFTESTDLVTSAGAYDRTYNGGGSFGGDAFVVKLAPDLSSLHYATYLGGSQNDGPTGLGVDGSGDAWVIGQTQSSDFPTSPNADDSTGDPCCSGDDFVTKLNPRGSGLLYSSYLGGTGGELAGRLAIDAVGSAYVTGTSNSLDFPTTPGVYDQTGDSTFDDAFVTKFTGASEYDTPAAASPLSVSLVPEFRQTISASQCQSRGGTPSTHGAPLVLGSCNPPAFLPGTPARFRGVGSAELTAVPGDLSTAADEADVAISASLTDMRAAAGGDYTPSPSDPDLTLLARLRISDTNNGAGAADPATSADYEYPVPIDCTATPDPATGSDCAVSTSVDSLTPGAILEGRSMVLQTFRVRVNDSGPNAVRGDGDDRRLASQGIYIP